jgi:4-coumarate--CoA ligase
LKAQEVVDWIRERVNPYKRLRGGVVFIDVIPKSPSGKILRRELKELALKEFKAKL